MQNCSHRQVVFNLQNRTEPLISPDNKTALQSILIRVLSRLIQQSAILRPNDSHHSYLVVNVEKQILPIILSTLREKKGL
jgi:hypothetical protein